MNVSRGGAPIDTLAEVLVAGIAMGEDGESVDGLELIATWVQAHFEGGAIARWLDAADAVNRLSDRLGYDTPELATIRDFVDPIPTNSDADQLEPGAVHGLLTRVNEAMVRMDRAIRDTANRPIARSSLANMLTEARPPAYLFGELGAMRDAAARAMRRAEGRTIDPLAKFGLPPVKR